MITSSDIPTRLTPLQQELLKLYAMELKEDELREVKDLLARYFLERLQRKVTVAARKKDYTQEDFDQWLNDPAQ
jgi:hypothetical protein